MHIILPVGTIFLSILPFYLVQIMFFSLEFRLNACSICLVCLDCQNIWSKLYLSSKKSRMEKKKVECNYTVDFCQRPLTQKDTTKRKVGLDKGFVDWILANISLHI